MNTKIVSLKPKTSVKPTLQTSTNNESNPAYSDKTSFPTIARKDDLPVKRKPNLEPGDDERKSEAAPIVHSRESTLPVKPKADPVSGDDERKRESAPIHIHREPDFIRRTQQGYSARHTTSRTRPPRVSRDFEAKFHALESRQKSLIEQTKLEGQLEYLTVSKSSSGKFWITVEGSGKPFIRISFETPEFCFECALELEETFDMLQVIKLRPGETMERIEEMIGVWLDRERVSRVLG